MNPVGELWNYSGSASIRLWDKSAIGRKTDEGSILLTDSEVIFCKDHRNLDFPHDEWLSQATKENPALLDEAAVLEALRVPGNKVVLARNLEELGIVFSPFSWGQRWTSNTHPRIDEAVSEVRWFNSQDGIDENDLIHWCLMVEKLGKIAEILVVDDEHSVVTYRLSSSEPMGSNSPLTPDDLVNISRLDFSVMENGGAFFSESREWPCDFIGIPLHEGRLIDSCELEVITYFKEGMLNFENGKFVLKGGENSGTSGLLLELWSRRLNTRPGFKYGTKWRCYPGATGDGHAPWLVIDPNTQRPENWGEACLSSRLASGVNKIWLYPIHGKESWSFLEISRPPSDSRWANPTRK